MLLQSESQFFQPRRAWIPFFVLLVGLGITALATTYVHRTTAQRNQSQLDHVVEEVRNDIIARMDASIGYLRAGAGLFAGSEEVTREEWFQFVERLECRRYAPGIQGIGFSLRIPPDQQQEVLRELRAAVPGARLWPEHQQPERHVIVYLEPMADERNIRALGYDMYQDPTRREAMDRARDEGVPIASGKVRLVQEAGERTPQEGFLIYVPVYEQGPMPRSLEERRSQLRGFVYSPYRMDDLLSGIFRNHTNRTVRFDVFDGNQSTAQNQMHRSAAIGSQTPRFHTTRPLNIAGKTWTLEFWSLPQFELEIGRDLTPFVLAAGVVLSGTLFMVTRSQTAARQTAEQIAGALRANEQALKLSESRFRRLADSNLIGVVFCDIQGKISRANLEFFRLIKHDREQVLSGRVRMDTLTAPEFRPADAVALAQLRTVGAAEPYEKELLRPDGSCVPVLIGMAMLEGSTSECVAFCIDLSESKQAAHELERAKDLAESANRAKDQFLAVLSHELRTPLTPVLALATAGQNDPDLPEYIRADFATIRRNVELEAKLIDDLLDLTKIGRGKIRLHLETVDVHQAIRHAINVCSTDEVAMKRLTLQVELHAPRHHARGDPARLQQIFWNLLKNAVKFTPPQGRITVATSNDSTGSIVVQVSDTGVGIDSQALPKIFEAFEQGDVAVERNLGGLGLGLAITKGLVQAHGGTISAHSDGPGRGSSFVVTLQSVATQAPPPLPSPPPPPEQPTRLSILLVEDHADTALALKRLLSSHGYEVRAADSVETALSMASEGEFDVIVSDLGLPDGSGLELMRQIRVMRTGRPTRGIALTGFGMEEDVAKSREAGFSEHITKPVNFHNLQRAIERVTAGGG